MQRSPIEWTDFTANPLRYRDEAGNIVHACIHKSAGCLHCYAEVLAKRWGRAGLPFTAENMKRLTPFLDEKELHHMLTYKPASGKMCFIGDMTDIFGEWVPDELLNQLFSNTLEMRENVTWQLVTKRADRVHAYLSWRWGEGRIPMRNIHIGVSVEDRKNKTRIDALRDTPAAVRFLSIEPLLEDIGVLDLRGIHWVICGGESGPNARPMNPSWARSARDQCQAAGVPFFFKQWGEWVDYSQMEWPKDCHSLGWEKTGERDGKMYGRITANGINETLFSSVETRYPWPAQDPGPCLIRVGKKAAGRLLDGRTWDEYPREAESSAEHAQQERVPEL